MPILRKLSVVAVLGTLLVAGAACDVRYNYLEDGLARPDRVTEIRISGGSGDVTVLADDTTQGVDVRRKVRYGEQVPGETMRVEGTTLRLDTECGRRCSMSYEVRVTRGVKVTGRNGSGNLTLRGVSDVDIELDSGNITVDGASGAVVARAGSGNIELDGIAGNVRVATDSGNIDGRDLRSARTEVEAGSGNITLDLPGTGDVIARTDSGGIEVRVPDRCCRVTASADSGDEDIQVGTDRDSQYELDLHTGSGNITVKARG